MAPDRHQGAPHSSRLAPVVALDGYRAMADGESIKVVVTP
jgi:hypothetical protein